MRFEECTRDFIEVAVGHRFEVEDAGWGFGCEVGGDGQFLGDKALVAKNKAVRGSLADRRSCLCEWVRALPAYGFSLASEATLAIGTVARITIPMSFPKDSSDNSVLTTLEL